MTSEQYVQTWTVLEVKCANNKTDGVGVLAPPAVCSAMRRHRVGVRGGTESDCTSQRRGVESYDDLSRYDVNAYPFNIIIDSNRVVLDVFGGGLTQSDLEKVLQ